MIKSFKWQRLPLMLLAWIFVAYVVTGSLAPIQQVRAQGAPASKTLVMRYEAMRVLAQATSPKGSLICPTSVASSPYLKLLPELSSDEFADSSKSPLWGSAAYATAPVPATLFGNIGERITCAKALSLFYDGKYPGDNLAQKRQAFLKDYYDTSGTGPVLYPLKNGSEARLIREVREYSVELIRGRTESFLWWRDRIISQAFNTCWKWGNSANPLSEATDAQRYNKDNWVEENGGDKAVGYMAESAIKGRYSYGTVTCNEVRDYIFDNTANRYLLGFSEGDLQEKLNEAFAAHERQQRVEAATEVLSRDSGAIAIWCVAGSSAPASFKNLPPESLISTLVRNLVDETEPFTYGTTDSVRGLTLTNAATTEIKGCLAGSELAADLEGALTLDLGDPPSAERSDPTEDVADDCKFQSGFLNWNLVKVGESALNWFGCTVIKGLTAIIDAATNSIGDMLRTSEDADQREQLQEVWGKFLTIANILFVIAFLIMTISTALNLGIFDAYTVKKLLPRIIAAAVLANLSFSLCYLMINLTNISGQAVYDIITEILPTEENFGAGAGTAIGATLVTAVAGIGAGLLTGGIFAVIPALLYALLGILVAYTIILIRRTLIILLVVLAPLAIVLWVLPGAESLAKRWWKTFVQMLMVYPIIMAFIAAGSFVSQLILQAANGEPGFFESISALIVLVLPLFLLPTVFKMASSTLANVTGMLNDKSRGLIDRSKKLRAQKMSEGWENIKGGKKFKGGTDDNFRGRLNKRMQRGAHITQAGFRPKNWRANLNEAVATTNFSNMQRALSDDHDYALFKGNDDLNRAASESHDEASLRQALRAADVRSRNKAYQKAIDSGMSEADAQAEGAAAMKYQDPLEMDNVVARVQRVRKKMGQDAFRRMTTQQAIAGGTAYDSADEVWEAVAKAGINDSAATENMIAASRSALMSAGRVDQGGAGFGKTLSQVKLMQDELRRNPTAGGVSDETRKSVNKEIHQNVYESQGGATLVHSSMKAKAVEQMTETMVGTVETAVSSGNDKALIQNLASLEAVHTGLAGSSPEKARIVADNVLSQKIQVADLSPQMRSELASVLTETTVEEVHERDAATGNMTVKRTPVSRDKGLTEITYAQAMNALHGNGTFREMSRQYSDEVDRQRNAPQAPGTTPGAMGGPPGAI